MPVTLFTSSRFADHLTPPGHPERVERFEVMHAVAAEFGASGIDVREPRVATRDELARIHERDYITLIAETAGRATALDADTYTSPATYDVARLAAGAVLDAVDHVLDSSSGRTAGEGASRAFALVRPPGHHAEADRAMGFCFFNNVAVGAAHARARGLERVAIVDYDVHHGNGTQWSFYTDPSVLFISSHQFPYYPGTGAATEIGSGAGRGFTINLPLAVGATDADYELVYERIAIPALRQFRPELILISAGFDAYMDDPLAGMRLTSGCFGRLTSMIVAVADECCDGRVVAATEGGYNLQGIADSLRAAISAMHAEPHEDDGAPRPARPGEATVVMPREGSSSPAAAPRGEATLKTVLPALEQFWRL